MMYKQLTIALAFLVILSLTEASKGKRGQGEKCEKQKECLEGLDCLEYWKDCGGECVCPGDFNHDRSVYIRKRCLPKLLYGQPCESDAQCSYTGGQCLSHICKCQQGMSRLNGDICGHRDNKRLGDACNKSKNWCYYVDRQHKKHNAVCDTKEQRCRCPENYQQHEASCLRRHGKQDEGKRCEIDSVSRERRCKDDLYCRKCQRSGSFKCMALNTSSGFQASMALVLGMLLAVAAKL